MSRVNGRELTLASIDGEPVKIPFNPFIMHLAAALRGVNYSGKYCTDPETLASCQVDCSTFFGIDHVNASTDAYREASAWGVRVRFDTHTPMPAPGGTLDWKRFQELETPDLNASGRIQERVKAVKLLRERAPDACVIGWIEAPLAELGSLFDLTGAVGLVISREGRDSLDAIMARILEVQREFAILQVEAGADIIGAGDSIASQFGPAHYKRVALAPTTRLFAAIQKHVPVLYHACGDNSTVDKHGNDMLALLASTGASVLDIDMEVDLALAKRKVGARTCLRGNTSTTVLGSMHYTPVQVMHEIQRAVDAGAPGGKYMYAAGCEWPWEPVTLAARNLGIAKTVVERRGAY